MGAAAMHLAGPWLLLWLLVLGVGGQGVRLGLCAHACL